MPPQSNKPALNELLSDDAARGIELVMTPVVFGGIGWLVDGWLGTAPWFTVALVVFAVVGTVAKLWYGYEARMRELESSGRWARSSERQAGTDDDRDLWSERKAAS